MSRTLGRGSIRRVRNRKGNRVYLGTWTDAHGKRHRKELAPDKRTADRLLAEIIRKRDMAIAGLGAEFGQDQDLASIQEVYVADLRVRRSPGYATRTNDCLDRILPAL